MTHPKQDRPQSHESAPSRGTLYVGFPYPVAGVLALLALWFVFIPGVDSRPEAVRSTFDSSMLSTEPLHQMMRDPASMVIGAYDQRCTECHAIFVSSDVDPPVQLKQHTEIKLRHGMNDRCYNCHSKADRSKLILHGGVEIGFDQVGKLCAQCHGTTYRDWEVGMHGRTMGSWDASSGKQRRLMCTECHDPHSPAYEPMVPMPAPNALRQGPQDPHGAHGDHDSRNPLTRRNHGKQMHDTDGDQR